MQDFLMRFILSSHELDKSIDTAPARRYYLSIYSYTKRFFMDKNKEDACLCRTINTERIEKARKTALDQDEHDKLANLFKAMGDPTRLKILLALISGEMCVCDLAAFLGISESAVSHQLRMLRQLYLVANRRQGPILYYRLNDEHIDRLLDVGLEHIRE